MYWQADGLPIHSGLYPSIDSDELFGHLCAGEDVEMQVRTVCPAALPELVMTRKPSSRPSCAAIFAMTSKMWATAAEFSAVIWAAESAMCSLG